MTRRPRGTGTIETTAKGAYRARFPFTSGERTPVGTFATREEAERVLDAILSNLHETGASRGYTLRMLGNHVLDLREREGFKSIKNDRNVWKNYVESWECLDAPVRTITRADVRTWLSGLSRKKLSVQTRRNALNLLRVTMRHGVDMELLETNPCHEIRVKNPGTTKATSTHLTADEAVSFLGISQSPEVAIALYTGLRQGEQRSLLWEDVHDDHILVRFGAPGTPPKNGKIREVYLLPHVREIFDALPRRNGLVFPRPDGGYRKKGHMVRVDAWKPWLAEAKLGRRFRWHDLRHTCATLLLQGAFGRKFSLEEVKEMLGHSSIRVTERYAKATGSLAQKAVREMFSGPNKPGAECTDNPDSRAISLRRGWDSNPRMTVLQAVPQVRDVAEVHALADLSRAYVDAVGRGDPFAHRYGLTLAEAVLDWAEALPTLAAGQGT